MPDHKQIYNQQADKYDLLVSREDFACQLLPAIQKITPLEGKDVVELGAGTGRLTCLLAPLVRSIRAYDTSALMLDTAAVNLIKLDVVNWELDIADHRWLPAKNKSADLVISGWSVCYLVDRQSNAWRREVRKALTEMNRVLRPGGTIMIIETQGTGFETPNPPAHLVPYYRYLEEKGFSSSWIRTDYLFQSQEEAVELTRFFFGDELAKSMEKSDIPILPECTGIWWRVKSA